MKTAIQKLGIIVVMLLSSFTTWAYDFEVDGKWYNVVSLDEMTCELTYHTQEYNSYSGIVDVPSIVEYNGRLFNVTRIGSSAFQDSENLTVVNLPETINEIGPWAFSYCKNLEHINLPESLNTIYWYAFEYCNALKSIALPSNLKIIESEAFFSCESLAEISIPASVSIIGEDAFALSGIERCIIEDSEDEIILYGGDVQGENHVYDGSFTRANMKYIYLGRNFRLKKGSNYSSHRYSPFLNLETLEEIVIGGLVSELPANTFVKVTNQDTNGKCSYSPLSNLKSLTVEDGNERLSFTTNIWGKEGYSPIKETSIADFKSIKKLVLKRNIDWQTNIGVLNGLSMFSHLEEAHLINNFSAINNYFFTQSSDLSYLELGENVATAGKKSFEKTHKLLKMDILSETPVTFDGNPGFNNNQFLNAEINVPKSAVEVYKNADVWKNFWNITGSDFSKIENVEIDNPGNAFIITQTGITALTNGIFDVYSLNGYMIKSCILSSGESIELSNGVYLVSFNGLIVKILIK